MDGVGRVVALAVAVAAVVVLTGCSNGTSTGQAMRVAAPPVVMGNVAALTMQSGYTFDLKFAVSMTGGPSTSLADARPGTADVSKQHFGGTATLTNTDEQRNLPGDELPQLVVKALWKKGSEICTADGALKGELFQYHPYAQLERGGCSADVLMISWEDGTVSPGSSSEAIVIESPTWQLRWGVPENLAPVIAEAAAKPDGYLIEAYLDPVSLDTTSYNDVQSPDLLRCDTPAGVPGTPVIWASARVMCSPVGN
ncbi:hypothetical protein [Nakamurella lactea]|uniref:hypothetical protein n=1 Tax=Nakamurella lactea TaxID=459515 RepID=UPI0012B57575|nr:hypothetical protein [Nakamurella lactea]